MMTQGKDVNMIHHDIGSQMVRNRSNGYLGLDLRWCHAVIICLRRAASES